jgi:transcriptional regulator with XRE-family HTH domain
MICSVDVDTVSAMSKGAGERLKDARVKARFADAADFANRVRIKPVTYRAYEAGQNGYAKHAALFAQKLGTSVEWLLYGTTRGEGANARADCGDLLSDVEAVTAAILLRLGKRAGEAEALGRVARQAVEVLQGHPTADGARMGRAQIAVDALWTSARQ